MRAALAVASAFGLALARVVVLARRGGGGGWRVALEEREGGVARGWQSVG